MWTLTSAWLPALALALAGTTATSPVTAQPAWPSKAVKLLAGSPPGGPSDVIARLFAEQLQKRSGQPVVVENRPGAGNNLAAIATAKAEPDGHTLVISPDTVLTVNPLVYRTPGFDARTDLVSVSLVAGFSQMLVCNPALGVKSVRELVAKAKSTRLTYAFGGPGVPGHLAAELLLQGAGIRMDPVPYRGPAPATLAVLSGEVNCGFLATPTVIPHVKAGKLDALAVSSSTPSPLAPDVPTLPKALGQPEVEASFWLVLQAASAVPAPVLAQIERATMDILQDPALRAKLMAVDLVAKGSTSAEAQQVMKREMAHWEPLVRRLDLKAE
jgi:tripartite-type tricarboxylate transporter receptor subunit TctC